MSTQSQRSFTIRRAAPNDGEAIVACWQPLLLPTLTATRLRRLGILFWTEGWCDIDCARCMYLWRCQTEMWSAPLPVRRAVKKVICEGWPSFQIAREAVSRRLCFTLPKLRSEISVA